MTRCFAFILLNLLIATPVAAEPNSETGTTTVERKEQCQKHCMGDNTPTEKANCLAWEKCEDRAACPKTSTKFNSGAAGQKVKGRDAKANSQ